MNATPRNMAEALPDIERVREAQAKLAEAGVRYVDARPGGAHGLAAAMGRETLEWVGEHHRAEADCRAVLGVMRAIAR